MKGQKNFYKNILTHTYQRPADGSVIFYSVRDHLVYFTIFCICARKHGIKVLSHCQMPDHVHDSVIAQSKSQLSSFVQEYTRRFSKEHNRACYRSGPFFESPYGWAQKHGDKKARTNLIYLGNNPVERRLVKKAEDYQWNFLAYAITSHPFSKKIELSKASRALRRALKSVKAQFENGLPMNYPLLKQLFSMLSASECRQLTDYIVSTYNIIDYKWALRFFNSYEDMISAMHTNTGSEYDINEVFVGKDDSHYAEMGKALLRELGLNDIHDFLSPKYDKYELYMIVRKHSFALSEQIAKYLRMKLRTEH